MSVWLPLQAFGHQTLNIPVDFGSKKESPQKNLDEFPRTSPCPDESEVDTFGVSAKGAVVGNEPNFIGAEAKRN